ncbi:ion transporter [Microbacterium gorillae]|uniref:ion transporter n=1 Tax=Microbacterium gorillae TaxID=1231063 RepID=UPI00058B4B86|nr:ion transporter [Microbacterium gorillae]
MTADRPWYTRSAVDAFVHSPVVQNVIIGVILVNAAILGLETVPALHESLGPILVTADRICLGIFVIEILLKLYGRGWRFFTNSWNVFDFLVVAVSLIPGADAFAVLRALRVLRVLRLVSSIPALRRVVDALVRALPGIASIAALLAIIFYVSAVMATMLFGSQFPEMFGTLGRSLFTLFQIMTLDNWSVISRDVWGAIPWAPAFFVPFVLISSLTVLNLFIAVIVDAMQGLNDDTVEEVTEVIAAETEDVVAAEEDTAAELRRLRAEIADLAALVRQSHRA